MTSNTERLGGEESRTSLLQQMRGTLRYGNEEFSLPSGDPPSSLETILDSEDWHQVFMAYIKQCLVKDEQLSSQLLPSCVTKFNADIFKKGKWMVILENMTGECKADVDAIVQDFPKYVQINQRLQQLTESRK